ncbi:MAG: DUF4190 domain-containing protein [Dehalococcoidia bacterium]|nr:MAG: DUF4190 domain-containing protein [Dehalococcoidia bacterium]
MARSEVQEMERQRTSGLAIASIVCGILSLVFFWVPLFGFLLGIIAIIFGAVAIRQIGREPNLGGRGMAVAGLVCGIVGVAGWVILIAWIGIFFWAA